MAGIPKPRLKAEIAWNSYAAGIFTIGFSQLSGADLIASHAFAETFTGPSDNISALVDRSEIERGRDDLLTTLLAGNAVLEVRDHTGLFNPRNPASSLAPYLDERLHPARISYSYGGFTYPWFYGLARDFEHARRGRRGITTFRLIDFYYWLDGIKPTIASTGPTTTGAAIGILLDYAELTEPAGRDLDVGDDIPDFSADGTKSILQIIGELLLAERGVFFFDAGVATYRDRHAKLLEPVAGTIIGSMRNVAAAIDNDKVRNTVQVERTQNGYVATATDAISISKRGPREHPKIVTPYLGADSQADGLAAHILSIVKEPRPALRALRMTASTPAQLTQILGMELGRRYEVETPEGGTEGAFHIERLKLTTTGRNTKVELLMSEASSLTPLVIGTGLIGTGQLTY